jgi:hypothetical protein
MAFLTCFMGCSITSRNTPAEYSHEVRSNSVHNDLKVYSNGMMRRSLRPSCNRRGVSRRACAEERETIRQISPQVELIRSAIVETRRVPVKYRTPRSTPEIALTEISRAMAAKVRFGCVLADAEYGLSAPFRQGLTKRGLAWAVGVPRHLKMYPVNVQLIGR